MTDSINVISIIFISIIFLALVYTGMYIRYSNLQLKKQIDFDKAVQKIVEMGKIVLFVSVIAIAAYAAINLNTYKESDSSEFISELQDAYNELRGRSPKSDLVKKIDFAFPNHTHNLILIIIIFYEGVSSLFYSVYMKPTLSVLNTDYSQKESVLILNILLGWTIIGWMMLLFITNPVSAVPSISEAKEKQPKKDIVDERSKRTGFDDKTNTLRKYKSLLDSGVITQDEFDSIKKDILSKL